MGSPHIDIYCDGFQWLHRELEGEFIPYLLIVTKITPSYSLIHTPFCNVTFIILSLLCLYRLSGNAFQPREFLIIHPKVLTGRRLLHSKFDIPMQ